MQLQYANAAFTTLSSGVNNSTTTIPVTANTAVGFPATAPYICRIKAEGGNTDEIILVTAGAGSNSWTVTRAYESYHGSSSASAHASGATIELLFTAQTLSQVDTRPGIDSKTVLHATCGDDFEASSLDARWTARNQASETFQDGGGSWMTYDITNAAADRGQFFQTDPGGDIEIILSFTRYSETGTMFGPMFIDSSGNGLGVSFYNSSSSVFAAQLVNYAYDSSSTSYTLNTNHYLDGPKLWTAVKVTSGSYTFRFSTNGYTWSPISAISVAGFTRDRIGFGRYFGTPSSDHVSIDRFNVI